MGDVLRGAVNGAIVAAKLVGVILVAATLAVGIPALVAGVVLWATGDDGASMAVFMLGLFIAVGALMGALHAVEGY